VSAACERCATPIPEGALACVRCHRLVHAEELADLSAQADAAEVTGDLSGALGILRRMIELLPPGTRQAELVAARVVALSERLDGRTGTAEGSGGRGWAAMAATAVALIWKGKFVVAFLLTKGKLLLVGLTKLPTLLSMFLSVGIYTSLFGWKFALGFVLSIYIHEMGHVFALNRYGIAASAPMFVPGLGAFVRMKQYPATAREEATVGLAGPLWGLAAALVAAVVWWAFDSPLMGAIARIGAWINLFNLLPVWQLDGARGWRALDRGERWIAAAALGVGWVVSEDTLVFVLALGGVFRAATGNAAPQGDRRVLLTYVGLVAALAGLLRVLPDPTR
jgi:Zn-dependent protease